MDLGPLLGWQMRTIFTLPATPNFSVKLSAGQLHKVLASGGALVTKSPPYRVWPRTAYVYMVFAQLFHPVESIDVVAWISTDTTHEQKQLNGMMDGRHL